MLYSLACDTLVSLPSSAERVCHVQLPTGGGQTSRSCSHSPGLYPSLATTHCLATSHTHPLVLKIVTIIIYCESEEFIIIHAPQESREVERVEVEAQKKVLKMRLVASLYQFAHN